jgi:hypothetical protein
MTQLGNTLFLMGKKQTKSPAQTPQVSNLNTAQMTLAKRGSSELFLKGRQVHSGCLGRLYLNDRLILAGADLTQAALRPDLLLLANICRRGNADLT